MANEENLKPFTSNRSSEEAVRNGKKGGVASGRARRRKKLLKDTVNMLLALPMQEGRLDRLTDLKSIKDKNITVEEAMVLKQIQNAMKGDLKAFESIIALSESHNKTGEQPKAQETDNAFIEALNGISGATYKRNGKLVQYSLEGTVRRDTLTAVNKLANKSSETLCEELGAEYVEISSHLGARTHPTNHIANHAGWQGKVFKIDGSDKKYPNIKESTGYPDDILGLGGVNFRHRMFPFFPGISTPNPIRFSEKENRRVYELTQKQRAMERRMRQLKKEQAASKEIGDKETVKKLNKKISEQSNKIDEFCKKNGLKRDFSRELVKEQIVKNKSVANSENSGIILARNLDRKSSNTGVFSNLGVTMQKKEVKRICEEYGFDVKGLTFKIQRSEHLLNSSYYGSTDYDNIGRIDLFPNAFQDEEELIKTIIHEKCHVEQLKQYGKKYCLEHLADMEAEAYQTEEEIFKKLTKGEK